MSPEREVLELLARYVRAVDRGNGYALRELFTQDGVISVFSNSNGHWVLAVEIQGIEDIVSHIANLANSGSQKGWSHHTTHDQITRVFGDFATIDAQFIRFDAQGHKRPGDGWPLGSAGVMGHVNVFEAGCYFPSFRRMNGEWKIVIQRIYHDLPFVV